MSSDPIVLDEETIGDDGTPRQRIQARAAVNSRESPDHIKTEIEAARHIQCLLRRFYPGHSWCVEVSIQKGGVAISLPVLLGGNWVYFIKGRDLTDAKVIEAVTAGETFVVTRNGEPVAELRPIRAGRRSFISRDEVIALATAAVRIDHRQFRADLDRLIDQGL